MNSASPHRAILSPEAIAGIRSRSIGLSERGHGTSVANPLTASHQPREEMWQAEAAGGRIDLFHKRLQWDGIAKDGAATLLSDDWNGPPDKDGEWLDFLAQLQPYESRENCNAIVDSAVARSTAPFATACRPFIVSALRSCDPKSLNLLPFSVMTDLARKLLEELCKIAAPVLLQSFQGYLGTREALPDTTRHEHYDHFSMDLGHGKAWADPLVEFAALARLIAVISLGWAADFRGFFAHLTKDGTRLARFFFSEDSLPLLTSIQSGISDRHNGAGTVKVLTFSNGKKLVYKRRRLELEADFHELLRTLAGSGLEYAPPALLVLPCDGYGWVEYAQTAPLTDSESLTSWFLKAGALLCLMHVLGGNDGHMENVIATAGGPVLIDLETLLQPGLPQSSAPRTGAFSIAAQRVHDSVLQTGLLPLWQRGRQGMLFDIGGLTAEGGYESPAPRLMWEHTGTDGINPTWRRGLARSVDNLPTLAGVRHPAGNHLPALCSGFSQMWRFLAAHPDVIHSALKPWSSAPLRVLLRPTTHYAALLERSMATDLLRNGIDRSLVFEALRRPFVQNHPARPALWPAVEQEAQALENGDIPVFFARAGGRDLIDAAGQCIVPDCFSMTPLESTFAKLDQLDEAGLQRQLEMIAAAFIKPNDSLLPESTPAKVPSGDSDPIKLLQTVPLMSDEGFIKTATMLGNQIIKAAICGHDGFVTWMAPAFLHPDQKEQRGVSYYLYDGAAGIALFLAALAKVTGCGDARRTAIASMEPVRAILDSPNAMAMIRREGIGGYSGLGSLIYSLTAMARLLDAPYLMERARRISSLIDPVRISRDQAFDMISGSAGSIMALLALYRACGDSEVLEAAKRCGNHLVDNAVRVGDDAVAWYSWPDRLLLAGYSHGAAGCAVALFGLYKATGDETYARIARAALQYERGLFDSAAGNWPILLPGGAARFAATWCHGAPGILLSRAAFHGQLGEAEDAVLKKEMTIARKTTLAAGLSSLDHLCCGTMGRAAILEATAEAMPGETNLAFAKLGATLTIRRAQQRKAFTLQADPMQNTVFQPGFFRGTSGIGYSLLRLARPDLVPSMLCWEI